MISITLSQGILPDSTTLPFLILFVNKKAYIKDILGPSGYGPEEKGRGMHSPGYKNARPLRQRLAMNNYRLSTLSGVMS